MPRRRPHELRDVPVRRSENRHVRGLPHASARLVGAVSRWEKFPGEVAWAVKTWADAVRRPHYVHYRTGGWDFPYEFRDRLQDALRALPRHAARELLDLVRPLDEIYLANTCNDPFAPRGDPWWRRRL
jgi:GrpB-like predicted nucleotidyltransferase (UPF0157 family)